MYSWVHSVILDASSQPQREANCHHVPASSYLLSQKVRLFSEHLSLLVDCRKIAAVLGGPFVNDCIINPSWHHLKLPPSLKVLHTFHVCRIMPVYEMDLVRSFKPSLTLNVNHGGPAYMVHCILDVCGYGCCLQFVVDCEWYGPEEKSWFSWNYILDSSLQRTFPVSLVGLRDGLYWG